MNHVYLKSTHLNLNWITFYSFEKLDKSCKLQLQLLSPKKVWKGQAKRVFGLEAKYTQRDVEFSSSIRWHPGCYIQLVNGLNLAVA